MLDMQLTHEISNLMALKLCITILLTLHYTD